MKEIGQQTVSKKKWEGFKGLIGEGNVGYRRFIRKVENKPRSLFDVVRLYFEGIVYTARKILKRIVE